MLIKRFRIVNLNEISKLTLTFILQQNMTISNGIDYDNALSQIKNWLLKEE